ncbi:MAG: helix-turn-helix transcriptional regulator [Flavobacteriales bacterium]|nr:helix-turn-helix transcriptional regulator [Flavobacteriales bacterium]
MERQAKGSFAANITGMSAGLTDREREMLLLIRLGKTNAEIASITGLSVNTVKTHMKSLFKKLHVRNRTEASHAVLPETNSLN